MFYVTSKYKELQNQELSIKTNVPQLNKMHMLDMAQIFFYPLFTLHREEDFTQTIPILTLLNIIKNFKDSVLTLMRYFLSVQGHAENTQVNSEKISAPF